LLPTRKNHNPLSVPFGRDFGRVQPGVRLLRFALALVLVFLLCASVTPDASPPENPAEPLPADTGVAGLNEMLLRLGTTARLMQTVAHPDDEDGGMLTLESRGKGDTVLLLTLNRGEGGQNKLGSNLFDVLGVLRTLELTAADRYYGVEQRFTRVADFGYSKTPEETFEKWQGHDIPLGDMVRVVRTFRPEVLVARFSGTSRDGHGHHQASSILTREAFHAAADPNRFPEQIKEGLQPWQVKKIYIGNVCGFGATTCADENYTVKLNTGAFSPALGMSYAQFALEGLRHQLSQGAGDWSIEPGDRFAFYKLVDSVLPKTTDEKGHEKDFFDGIDTTLPGLTRQIESEAAQALFLRPALIEIQSKVELAKAAVARDPASAVAPLVAGLQLVRRTIEQVKACPISSAAKDVVLTALNTKEAQFEKAVNLAAGVVLRANADVPAGTSSDDAFMAVPGQSFNVKVYLESKSTLDVKNISLDLPSGWKIKRIAGGRDKVSGAWSAVFKVTVSPDAQYTRPYWHRDDPERDAINSIDNPQYITLPFPPPPVHADVTYAMNGGEVSAHAVAMVTYKGPNGRVLERPVAVAPAFSVLLEPGQQVVPTVGEAASPVRVAVSSNLSGAAQGQLHLEAPAGWRVEPAGVTLQFDQIGQKRESDFKVFHANLQEGRTQIRALFESGGKKYSEGYSVVTREDLNTFYYYQPAIQHVSIVDVKVPSGLKVGYIQGAGDDIPGVLQQIGMDVTMIPAEKLATENLSQFGTIVLGIRAYGTQKDVVENNKKLLDYVAAGGTLVVQYNTDPSDFNKGNYTPYPATLSRARVSVEEAPVEILAPEDSVFHYPNEISQRDFDGWVQERGLYFMDKWDDHFKPLLSCHDPGESDQKGGLLRASYGKGTYIYTGYAFFRQLPAGVPGAIRLYVNLLSAGKQ
jgi:LmbE family N-acetylglucosaminyl deacetylase